MLRCDGNRGAWRGFNQGDRVGFVLRLQLIKQTGDMYIISQTGCLAIGAEETKKKPQQRDGTKQGRMIAHMQRAEGDSIDEICSETGW